MKNGQTMDKRIIKGEETKQKILKASIELFSQKGYDATSVNEISKKAKLTKSLLYHHFKNKESILIQVMNDYIKRTKEIFDEVATEINPSNIDEFHYNFHNTINAFLSENKKIIKILLAESFNHQEITFNLFEIFNDFKKHFYSKASEPIKTNRNELELIIENFYIRFLPPIIFSVLNDAWCEYYKIKNEDTQKIFANIMNKIKHDEYKNKDEK
jgi:AcrR family transcriptional regulator